MSTAGFFIGYNVFMPLSPWILVLTYSPPALGLLYAWWKYREARDIRDILIPLSFVGLYMWIALAEPEIQLRILWARYVFLFAGGIWNVKVFDRLHNLNHNGLSHEVK